MSGKTSHSTTLSYYNTLKLHIVHALPLVIGTPLPLQVVTLSLIATTTVTQCDRPDSDYRSELSAEYY
jgi:hypothetical protein